MGSREKGRLGLVASGMDLQGRCGLGAGSDP